MARNDMEAVVLKIVAHVKATINDTITAINTEKADDVELLTIDALAYDYQDFGSNLAPNYDPFVTIHASSGVEDMAGAASSETVRMLVEIVTSDRGYAGSERILKLLARYRRALREVLTSYPRMPQGFTLIDAPDLRFAQTQGQNLWSVAIGITFTIAH